MKNPKKFLALVMCSVLAFCMAPGLIACGNNAGETGKWVTPEIPADQKAEPPAPTYRVYSVMLQYNDNDIDGGVLSVDKTAGTINVTAAVLKDEQADGTVVFDSSDKTVATISDAGLVTLLEKGETVLSATVGNKSHRIVLIVKDDYAEAPESYTVTVNGGTSSVSSAAAGEYVTLNVDIPLHMDFTGWRFPNSVTWVSGNVFKMPDNDVEITAEFTDMLYTLNVVGATITEVDGEKAEDGENGGFTNDGNTVEYAITTYRLPYDCTIDVSAVNEPNGKIFIGWDYGSQDNRAGDMGVPELSFTMPDETFTVWAVFGDLKSKVLTARSIDGVAGSTAINNGIAPNADFPDPVYEGLSGYRVTINARATYNESGYTTENIQGSDLNSIETGTRLMKAIFKNNSEGTVTVEVYASYYGILATSGRVTVAGGETKKVFFTAGMGIDKPWMGFAVRENNSNSAVVLDMVLGSAPMYPKGDKSLAVTGGPEYVKLKDANSDFLYKSGNNSFSAKNWYREYCIANKFGAVYIANYAHGGCYSDSISAQNPSYLCAPIMNLPAFDENDPKGVIYGKYLNLALNDAVSVATTLKLVISTTNNPAESAVASFDIDSTAIGDMFMFKLEWDRVAGQNYYFSIVKEKLDASGTYDANSFCIQMVYNNCIGYEEA